MIKKRIIPLLLSLVFLVSSVMTVSAATVSQDGIEASLTTSKTSYKSDETVDVSLNLKNTGSTTVEGIEALLTVPEGMKLSNGTLLWENISLAAGESKSSMPVQLVINKDQGNTGNSGSAGNSGSKGNSGSTGNSGNTGNAANKGNSTGSPSNTGDTYTPVLWCMLMLASGTGLVVYVCKKKKSGKQLMSLTLVFAIGAGMLAGMPAEAAVTRKSFTVFTDITVGGAKKTLSAEISYNWNTEDPEEKTIEIYVANNGKDTNSGTFENPVQTLERARDLVREKNQGKIPVTVYLRGGEYVLSNTLELSKQDSGTKDAPVVYCAYPGEKVVLTGSKSYSFSKFKAVDGSMKDLLTTEEAKNQVVVADASDLGMNQINVKMDSAASNFTIDAPMLMLDSHNMNLTRYPNSINTEDWIMAETINPDFDNKYPTLQMSDEEVLSWTYQPDDYLYFGYVAYGWAASGFKGNLDIENKTVTATDSVHYGSSSGEKPVRVLNAYESMDEPGEWYYDKTTDRLYVYPYEDTDANSKLYITENTSDLISVQDASYVFFEDLTLMSSKGSGFDMNDVDHCVVDNCRLLSFTDKAISIDNATNSGIKNSEIAYNACTAIYIDGGQYSTLTSGGNYISNNMIHDTNQYRTFNEAGIKIRGVGTRFDHNEVYNISDMALNLAIAADEETSAETIVEYNVFHDCIINGKDMGAIYAGRDIRCQGTVIRNNYFYDLGNNSDAFSINAAAIYADDGLSGMTVTDNVFGPGCSGDHFEAFKVNSGHDHVFSNNLLIDIPCMFDIYVDDSFETRLLNDGYGTGITKTVKDVWKNEIYTQRWPWLAEAANGSKDFYIKNIVQDNVLIFTDTDPHGVGTGYADKWYSTNEQDDEVSGLAQNLVVLKAEGSDNRSLFVDYAKGNFALSDTVLSQLPDFHNIDLSKTGLQAFEYYGKNILPGGNKPSVSNVSIDGNFALGETVKAVYDFADADGDKDAATYANFYIAGSEEDTFYLNIRKASDNTTKKEFTITPPCEGKWLICEVVPVDSKGVRGVSVWSAPVQVELGVVDKTDLQAKVNEANELLSNAVIGTEDGQWSQKEVDLLTEAVEIAQAVLDSASSSQYDVDCEIKVLVEAIQRFKNNCNGGAYAANLMEINPLIADATNWQSVSDFSDCAPVFVNGEAVFTSAEGKYSVAGYAGAGYSNKVFSFRYRQTLPTGNEWGGFFLKKNNANSMPWADPGLLVTVSNSGLEMQIRDGKDTVVDQIPTDVFADGNDHEVLFGMYDENSTDVKIVLIVDGLELYSKSITNEVLHSAEVYFGAVASPGGTCVTIGNITHVVTVDAMIADAANWQSVSDFKDYAPVFANGEAIFISAEGQYSVAGYAGQSYCNKTFSFRYGQILPTGNEWGGFFLKKNNANSMPWADPGLLVTVSNSGMEMQIRDGKDTVVDQIPTDVFADGKAHEVLFGMYDENSTDVRIVLTVDGTEFYNKVVTNDVLHSSELYFGAVASPGGTKVTVGSVSNVLPVDAMIADSENWQSVSDFKDYAPVFANGEAIFTSAEGQYSVAGYAGAGYSNKVFSFRYRQTLPTGNEWGGFFLKKNNANSMPWADPGLLVTVSNSGLEMQIRDGKDTIVDQIPTDIFADGKDHDVTFGMHDVNSTDVKIVLTADGTELYNKEITNEVLHSAELYFGAVACPGGTRVVVGSVNTEPTPEPSTVYVTSMLNNTDKWIPSSEWPDAAPDVSKDAMILESSGGSYSMAGYNEKYQNTVFNFKYSHKLPNIEDPWSGFYFNLAKPENIPWADKGLLVCIKEAKVEMQIRDGKDTKVEEIPTTVFADEEEHEVIFGMYDINATDVNIVLRVDGTDLYNKVITNEVLHSAEGYFGAMACPGGVKAVVGTEPVVVPNGWEMCGNAVPTLKDGKMTLKNKADSVSAISYVGQKYKNQTVTFKYSQTIPQGEYGGFYMNLGSTSTIPWGNMGVSVLVYANELRVQARSAVASTTDDPVPCTLFADGSEHTITFGVYDIDQSTNKVKITVSVDGNELYTREMENETLFGSEGYFSVFAGPKATVSVRSAD